VLLLIRVTHDSKKVIELFRQFNELFRHSSWRGLEESRARARGGE
jgi:hypothetical protein